MLSAVGCAPACLRRAGRDPDSSGLHTEPGRDNAARNHFTMYAVLCPLRRVIRHGRANRDRIRPMEARRPPTYGRQASPRPPRYLQDDYPAPLSRCTGTARFFFSTLYALCFLCYLCGYTHEPTVFARAELHARCESHPQKRNSFTPGPAAACRFAHAPIGAVCARRRGRRPVSMGGLRCARPPGSR